MDKKSITFVFHQPSLQPVGGFKMVYEYANRLAEDGYDVHIAYAMLYHKSKNIKERIGRIARYFMAKISLHYSGKNWFQLHKNIKEHFVSTLTYNHLPHTHIYVATAIETAKLVSQYPRDKKNKLYFIQDFEDWKVSKQAVLNSYHLDLTLIVVSKWLGNIVAKENLPYHLVPNGFDFNVFSLQKAIEKRDATAIIMLYHNDKRKGIKYGIEALSIVKAKYPNLQVTLFGTPERPKDLPQWYQYFQKPNKATHNKIYNTAAIFVGTSLKEGWGLTVGEAMQCGCAVVCTNNDGYKEMAIDGRNALLCDIEDAEGLSKNIIQLIEDKELRIKLAKQGNQDIQQFDIENSYKLFKSLIDNS